MKTHVKFMALALLGVLWASCNKPAEPASSFDLEKAKADINAGNQKLVSSISTGDSVGFASVYHSQAIVMAPNSDPVSGTNQIASMISGAIKVGFTGLKLETTSVWGSADAVIEEGVYETLSNNETTDKGKYIAIWKGEGGTWKLFRDIWNSNMPMPPPPAESK
jgi:ketosteroid isomerase-like protein